MCAPACLGRQMTLDQFQVGIRVYIVVSSHPEKRLGGRVGRVWDHTSKDPYLIVQFDNGLVAKVNDTSAHFFLIEPNN